MGERLFTSLKETLTDGSGYFKTLFSGRRPAKPRADGSYFLDADKKVFPHILHYLRHGLFSLLYDRSKGFDYRNYAAISNLAEFLMIEPLVEWISGQRFHKAVTITLRGHEYDGVSEIAEETSSNEHHSFHPTWQTVKIYACPRGIDVHRVVKQKCGRAISSC